MNLKRHMCAALRGHLSGGQARFSPAGLPLWQAFVSLSSARRYNPGGPNPISYPEIEAWCRLMRVPLEPRHVEVIPCESAQDFICKVIAVSWWGGLSLGTEDEAPEFWAEARALIGGAA